MNIRTKVCLPLVGITLTVALMCLLVVARQRIELRETTMQTLVDSKIAQIELMVQTNGLHAMEMAALVSRLPEMGRIIPGTFRHVSVLRVFQIFPFRILPFALDVIGVVCSLSLASKFDAEVIGRHGFSPPQERTVSRRRRETYKCASF